ncbi:MAG: TrkH family potassium uptake protein [Planctomycetota bacterium]
MNLRYVSRVVGLFLLCYAPTMLLPLLVGWLMDDSSPADGFATTGAFVGAAGVTVALALLLLRAGERATGEFFRKESILSVALVWYLAVACSALPFVFSGSLGLVDGVFESASGLTTTGASAFGGGTTPKISQLPSELLFWRALTHWIGGLGIIVMFLVVLPVMGTTQKRLYVVEVPGISKDTLRPKLTSTVLVLFRIYLVLTLAIAAGYLAFGMNVFEAVCHSFATIATGGFSTRDYSIGEFGSLGIETVCLAGMLLSGTSFGLYYKAVDELRRPPMHQEPAGPVQRLRRVFKVFWSHQEFRLYITMWLLVSLGITVTLVTHGPAIPDPSGETHDYSQLGQALRGGSFAAASLSTSTGFANRDFLGWPFLAHALLILVMLHGGCSGSTSGGLKVVRFLLMLKLVGRGFRRFLRPRRVEKSIHLGEGQSFDAAQLRDVVTFTAAWFVTLLVGGLAVLFLAEVDELTAFTSVLSCMGNIGPGITEVLPHTLAPANDLGVSVGPYGSYGTLPAMAKLVLSFVMVAGRLEVYTAVVVFVPSFWRD